MVGFPRLVQAPEGARLGPVAAIFTFAALGGLLFGWDIGATTYVVTQLQDPNKAGVAWGERIEASSILRGFFTASAVGGALLGTMMVFRVEGNLGRRGELLVAAFLYILGGVMEFISSFFQGTFGLALCLFGRWVYGGGISFAMHGAPAYLAEMSPPAIRGFLVALKEGMIVLGILLAQVAGFGFQGVVGGWRWTFFLSVPLACLMGLGMARLPPSARWLALQGRWDEAEASLRFFMKQGVGAAMEEIKASCVDAQQLVMAAAADSPPSPPELQQQDSGGESMMNSTNAPLAPFPSKRRKEGLWTVLSNPRYRWSLIVGVGVVLLQQISGQPSVLYYTNEIFENIGLPSWATLVVGLFKLVATLAAVLTVDRYGRRTLLLTGIALMLLALAMLTTAFSFYDEDGGSGGEGKDGKLDAVLVFSLLLYILGYQIGFGPISWCLVSEIYPTEVRGETVALAVMTNFGFNLIVTLFFDSLREALGTSATFGLFLGIAVFAWIFVYTCLPETKGLSLEMIETLFASTSASSLLAARRQLSVEDSSFSSSCPSWWAPCLGRRARTASSVAVHQQQQAAAEAAAAQQGINSFIEQLLPVEKRTSAFTSSVREPFLPSSASMHAGEEGKMESGGGDGGAGGAGNNSAD